MTAPYYADDRCELYLGKMEEVLPTLGRTFDACVTDPPYGETSLAWDRWVDGWPALVAQTTASMWCFGSMRMFLQRVGEFTGPGWKLSQDVVWEKHNGSSRANDRFRRIHEYVLHWYSGKWSNVHHEAQRVTPDIDPRSHRGGDRTDSGKAEHLGSYALRTAWIDDGTRLLPSVLRIRSMHHEAVHPTEKPAGILRPLIEYACPPGGVLLDPFAGSGSTLATAKAIGRRAIGIEGDEMYAEIAAKRLCQDALDFDEVAS